MGACNSQTENRKKFYKNRDKFESDIIYNSKFRMNNNCFELEKIGFDNIGNSCYMNSFLQILLHIPNFLKNLRKDYNKSKKESQLIKNIINLSDYPNNKKYLYLIQNYMSNISSNYEQFNQSDSQNFGIDLINEIIINIKGEEDETSSEYNKNINKNIINIINYKKNKYNEFIKKYQNENQQISLEKMFNVNESENYFYPNGDYLIKFNCFFHIELSFQKNDEYEYSNKYLLQDLLYIRYNQKKEVIQTKKNSYSEMDKISKICKLPKILIITISRAEIGENLKRFKLVIPNEIDLSKYIDKDLIRKRNLKYRLFAINEKKGKSKTNGHYYCFIKIENIWYLFDDENVTRKAPNFTSRNVVGLFYEECE